MPKDIAVVTGASGGIGRAIAKMIHEKTNGEICLALHYNSNQKAAESLKAEIPGSFLVQADLSRAEGRTRLLEATLNQGTPYILINSAGVDRPYEPALEVQENSFDSLMNINLKAPLFLMKMFAKEMARSESGIIINISSALARKSLMGMAVYHATKAALEALTEHFAFELGTKGIRVNALAPGFIETTMTASMQEAVKENVRHKIPLGKYGDPQAVASAVCHLIENDYINGVTLRVDGGLAL